MQKKNILTFFIIALTALLTTTSCSLFEKSDNARVKFVMVSGNYLEPRLLCELAQDRTKQPIVIYDSTLGESNQLVYFSGNHKSTTIQSDKFSEFLDFMNPKIIIFIGANNGLFYPEDLLTQASDKYRIITLESEDWHKNCQTLSDILGVNRMTREYSDLLRRILMAERIQMTPKND